MGRSNKAKTPYDDWQKQSAVRHTPKPKEAAESAKKRRALAKARAATAEAAAARKAADEAARLATSAASAAAAAAAQPLHASSPPSTSSFDLKIAISSADPAAVGLALQAGANPKAAEPVVKSEVYLGDLPNSAQGGGGGGGGGGSGGNSSTDVSGGEFPLIWCAHGGGSSESMVAIVRQILDAGADPNQRMPGGETAAYLFASRGLTHLLAPLKAAGGSLELAEESMGETPLFASSRRGLAATVAELLRLGASPSVPSGSQESPLWIASRRGYLEVVSALLAAGADVNAADEVGETPLMKAAEYGHVPVLKALLAAGADPSIEALHGGTALSHAVEAAAKARAEDGAGAEKAAEHVHHGGECEACATMLRARAGSKGTTML